MEWRKICLGSDGAESGDGGVKMHLVRAMLTGAVVLVSYNLFSVCLDKVEERKIQTQGGNWRPFQTGGEIAFPKL